MANDEYGDWFQWGAPDPQARSARSGLAPEAAGTDSGYDPEAALLCAVASTWAYSDAKTLARTLDRSMLPGAQARLLEVHNSARLLDTQVFVVRQPELGRTIVAFRGTEVSGDKLTDLLTDLLVAPIGYPRHTDGKVHRGFLHGLIAVWPDLLEALTEHPEGELFITGHSLGGALASLMTVMLCLDKTHIMQTDDRAQREAIREKIRGVYTFGQPMVGNPEFAELADTQLRGHGLSVVRHVFDDDVIPHLPGKDAGPFAHFGVEMTADEQSDRWTRNEHEAAAPVKRSVLGLLVGTLDFASQQLASARNYELSRSLSDHMPQHYVDICKRHVFEAKKQPIPFYP